MLIRNSYYVMYQKVTFKDHFSCRNHLSTNTSVTYYAPTSVGRGIKRWWPSSVCLSVPCLDLNRELKGPEAHIWHHGSPWPGWPVSPFQSQKVKGQGHRADYSWHTKCAVSFEREGLRTSNLVDGRSLHLRKSHIVINTAGRPKCCRKRCEF